MYVWTSGGAGNCRAKCQIRNPVLLQKIQKRAALDPIGMKLDIHCVVMVQSPAIVNWSLSEYGDGKLLLESVVKEALYFPGVAEVPASSSGVTRERRGA